MSFDYFVQIMKGFTHANKIIDWTHFLKHKILKTVCYKG